MQVFVTPNAEEDFDSIVKQIRNQWGERTAKQFLTKADKVFNLLQSFPAMGQIENGEIRGFQLSPQTRILYRITDNRIIILSFFDTRQDPAKRMR
ncbi:MAG: type II toxin-antitoxin system RelE/ParE family toxin [Bacteroidetes bacterium]|nr:type II toxin-antitoxin system RelE/ParE family toxin [Bacteroidota bacterium]